MKDDKIEEQKKRERKRNNKKNYELLYFYLYLSYLNLKASGGNALVQEVRQQCALLPLAKT